MPNPRLPDGWTEDWLAKWPYRGILAVCSYSRRLIEYWGAWWLALFRWALRRHERGHAWGIEECLSKVAFSWRNFWSWLRYRMCVMAEDDDTWAGKAKLLPLQALGLGRYCPACTKYLKDKGAFDA